MTLVVDASVALKWFVAEAGSAAAIALLEGDRPLIAPELVLAELCNAAWRLLQRGELVPEQVEAIAAHAPLAFAELSPLAPLTRAASRIAVAVGHPAYDCFYLALAEARAARLVTADRRLLSATRPTPWAELPVHLDEAAESA
ncbi:MAG: type II toxin-antitoxin system VapC family toxin [Proteobacteria bacterium]|nr:type II toxin-antitoxin system VapC family toxin [Pseudomonadota bacterium]